MQIHLLHVSKDVFTLFFLQGVLSKELFAFCEVKKTKKVLIVKHECPLILFFTNGNADILHQCRENENGCVYARGTRASSPAI